ncbi:MAG: glycosyltransferase family 4 protein [Solirubrobacterales bacterium]|nr:glycosyltransferase family 4 protein [Solirubrobacterales bacterium]
MDDRSRAPSILIVGVSSGPSHDPHNNSGTVAALFAALERRGDLIARLDVSPSRLQRYRLAAASYRPNRSEWKRGFRRTFYEAQSSKCGRLVGRVPQGDVLLSPFRQFQPRGLPYWLLLDTTDAIRREGREPPFGPDALGRDAELALYLGAEHIFTMPEAPRTSLIADYGVDERRVTTVGAGVNIAYPSDLGELARPARYANRTILFVAHLGVSGHHHNKGVPELLEAFAIARRSIPDAKLVVLGGRLDSDPPGVTSVGEVSDREEVARRYAESAVFCLPSRFEPTGMSIMEAMAFGLPVIGTRVGGIPEAVVDGETGLLVAVGDVGQLANAMIRLLDSPGTAREMGLRGRARIDRELNWDAVVERMLSAASHRGRTPG